MTRPSLGLALLALAAFVACVASACAADTMTAPADCANALDPRTFRLVLASGDTTPRMTNRYLEPHRSTDVLIAEFSDHSGRAMLVADWGAGYCETSLDSALFHSGDSRRVD